LRVDLSPTAVKSRSVVGEVRGEADKNGSLGRQKGKVGGFSRKLNKDR
jgi:hypothetical protein